MIEKDNQLLCTFSTQKTYQKDIEGLSKTYEIYPSRIYVITNLDSTDEVFLTYNVSRTNGKFYPKTISVHRKREHNILYSINALNELVKLENNGKFITAHQINWSLYNNSLITVKDEKIKIVATKLLLIHRIEPLLE